MRKELFLLLIIFLLFLVYIFIPSKTEEEKSEVTERKAVFISYIELGNYIRGKDVSDAKKTIDDMIKNVNNFGFNMIILQVRSFSDAIYPSTIFPSSRSVVNMEGDIFLLMY